MTVTPKVIVLSSVATLVYLGLAVLGSGGFAAFFSHPQLTVVAIATLVMAVAALFTEGNLSSGERENRDNRWVLAAFGVSGFLLAYLPALTDRFDVWT
ncbi:isoprenylcysteine carboxylmethyltransferase family protein, partial [Burkholderia sola]|nr:isoprenylcysteine carboxylmethyltransferase family protein [Burkholderia sola]